MNESPKLSEAALAEYLDECREMLERFAHGLATIEANGAAGDALGAIYRDMHTIKGTSQLFGFSQIGQLTHAMETCLDPVRKGLMKFTNELVDALYAGVDIVSTLLAGIRETKREPDAQGLIGSLMPRLVAIAESGLTRTEPPAKDQLPAPEDTAPPAAGLVPKGVDGAPSSLNAPAVPAPAVAAASADPSTAAFGIFDEPEPAKPLVPPAAVATEVFAKPAEPPPPAPRASPAAPKAAAGEEAQQSETIRVHVSLLDNLMNMVGELVLIRNQVLQYTKAHDEDPEFLKMGQRLNILTAELQNEVMKTRMQPIGNILTKFTRVVRDMGRDLGKKIELELTGADTELDKTIIEAIKDPLTHVVRNAVDHGIEAPADRRKSGKSEAGLIRIKAYHESGQVIIEVTDDGRGLDRHKLGAKAVERGILSAEAVSRLSDKEAQSLIFAPGFSTAESVSNISGRGVGMDVVKTNVERIGGIVDLSSLVGFGTTIKLKIPLTLAIVPALIVRSGKQRFAIPQAKLVELLRIDETEGHAERIEMLQGRPVLRLRGRILPLIGLNTLMAGKVPAAAAPAPRSTKEFGGVTTVVVLNADNFQFGLIVDEIEDSADIVVKSLSQFLKELTIFSGATIMGDGAVALTLDIMGIAETAGISAPIADAATTFSTAQRETVSSHRSDVCEFLLMDVGAPGSYAIPLSVVSRLEEFEHEKFELSGEQRVVRYRGSLLPVFSLPRFLDLPFDVAEAQADARRPVVVVKRGERLYGIEVRAIQDVVAVSSPIDHTIRDRPGILGTMVSQDRVIVVVDIFGMIDALRQSLDAGTGHGDVATTPPQNLAARGGHRILLVEDSSFFRNHVRQVLLDAGYQADTACDGAEGYATLDREGGKKISLVLSDIEMPLVDGYELARKIRKNPKFVDLPLVAITTRFSAADIEVGRTAGFTRYLEKLNADKLISELDDILAISRPEVKRASNG